VGLVKARYEAYPRSPLAKGTYAASLLLSNQPRAAYKVLSGLEIVREEYRPWYWWEMAATRHMLGEHRTELEITDRWRDSSAWEWQLVRARALAALGREREVMDLVALTAGLSIDSVAGHQLGIATELAVHGHGRAASILAERTLARLELGPDTDVTRAAHIAWANRLLRRREREREALERVARGSPDGFDRLESRARIAVLLADRAQAAAIDSVLAAESDRPLRDPRVRGRHMLVRAELAAGFGRREQAVALLRDAAGRGTFPPGPAHVFHQDLLLASLRGYPPFDDLLKPAN
jgi:hypothetical protein